MSLPPRSPLAAVTEALDDADAFLSDCAEAYFDPAKFRRSLNAYVQAARNITFRIQSIKEHIPEFQQWYEPWQTYMKAQPLLTWIVAARNTVTKQSGLQTASRARVKITRSYVEPSQVEFDVDPQVPMSAIVDKAVSAIPSEYRAYWTVEVSRRWELDDVPGKEVLAALAEASRIYAALVGDLYRHLSEPNPPLPLMAVNAMPPVPWAASIEDRYTVMVDPRTREVLTYSESRVEFDGRSAAKAVEVFGAPDEDLVQRIRSSDMVQRADAHIEMAMHVLKSQGEYHPMFFFTRADGTGEMRSALYKDKRDKFVLFERLGQDVRRSGFEAVIFVGEMWTAALDRQEAAEYMDIATLPGRGESLVVVAANASGFFRCSSLPFYRRGEEIDFGERHHDHDPASFAAVWPILRVWGLDPSMPEDRPASAANDPHGADGRGRGRS